MRKILCLLFFANLATAQQTPKPVDRQPFAELIKYFQTGFPWSDRVKPPLIYEPAATEYKRFRVVLSDSALHLQPTERLVQVPYTTNPFPLSYSVIYQNRLVSLFEPGQFVCLALDGLTRDSTLEKKLNTKRFAYHWLLTGHLVGLSDKTYYRFDEQAGWRRYDEPIPMSKQPKYYEDDRYIAYSTCRGEFGGTLFLYDKRSRQTHFSPFVCCQSVIHKADGYYVLASLGHGMGSADLSFIEHPSRLPLFKGTGKYGDAIADSAKLTGTVKPTELFDYYGLQLFAGFMWHGKLTYVAHWSGRTFLAEIADNTLIIKDPLFNDDTYTHEPVTTQNGNTVLINLDFYGVGREREVACLLLRDQTVVKLNWNKLNPRN